MVKKILKIIETIMTFIIGILMGVLCGCMYFMIFYLLFMNTEPTLYSVSLVVKIIIFFLFNVVIFAVTYLTIQENKRLMKYKDK